MRLSLALLALAAGVIALASPRDSAAGGGPCGGVEAVAPKHNVGPGRAPLMIGDSPMLLALPGLSHLGYRANAHGCRQWGEGMSVLKAYKHRHPLPRLVVIALGSNGTVSRGKIHRALHIVGKHRTLGLWTPRELGGGSGFDAQIMRKEAKRHPNRTELLDWVHFSRGHKGWFQPDGLHLTDRGVKGFLRLARKPLRRLPHR